MKHGLVAAAALLLAGCADDEAAPGGVAAQPAEFANGVDPLKGCKVQRVVDGDTLLLSCDDGRGDVSARLLGYDTPEIHKSRCEIEKLLGYEAALRLGDWLLAADDVAAEAIGRDRYGRLLMRLVLDGEDIAERMVGAGLGVPYGGGRRIDWCARLAETKASKPKAAAKAKP